MIKKRKIRGIGFILMFCMLFGLVSNSIIAMAQGSHEAIAGTTGFTTTPMISAGGSHTVALKSDGTVWAWGWSRDGQLGDGTTNNSELSHSSIPVQVLNLYNITAISAGAGHTVALRNDGTVWAWGRNRDSQLGDGTTTNSRFSHSSIPVQVLNLYNITAISAGGSYTVALRNDGTVWTWGSNDNGQLGDGTTTNRHTPVQVQSLSNITAISAGEVHTVALRNDGTVWTWGRNCSGQLGDGTTTRRHTPVQVQNLSNITAISAGAHTIALRNDGTVWVWGWNRDGQLGDGTTTNRHTPVQVQSLSNITAISAGNSHTVALRNDNTVWAWGRNGSGELGDGTTISRHRPVQVQNLYNITAISAGSRYTITLKNDGTMWTWGANGSGQLGTPIGVTFHNRRSTPAKVRKVNENGVGYFNLNTITPPSIPNNTDTIITLNNRTGIVGMETTISGTFMSSVLELGSETLNWTVCTPNAITFGHMSVLDNFDENLNRINFFISRPILAQRAGTFTVTVTATDGTVAQAEFQVRTDQLAGLFDQSSFDYNHELATLSAELSAYVYNDGDIRRKLERLGMRYIVTENYGDSDLHTVAYAFATREIMRNNRAYNLIIVAIRGTYTNNFWRWDRDMGCNFTVGPTSCGYHAGFKISQLRLREDLLDYLVDLYYSASPRNILDPARNIFLITGHSRGGAVANLLSAELNRGIQLDEEIELLRLANSRNIHTYTFASANVRTSQSTAHNNIFNIINTRDILTPNVPPRWHRYGVDLFFSSPTVIGCIIHGFNTGICSSVCIRFRYHQEHQDYPQTRYSPHAIRYTHLRWMRNNDENAFYNPPMNPQPIVTDSLHVAMLLSFNSPVDIKVYDSQDNLVGEIVNNVAKNIQDSEVLAFVIDNVKQFILPSYNNYTIKIRATDRGVLTYTIERLDVLNNTLIPVNKFENVTLYTGREFISEINDITDVRLLLVENGIEVGEIAEDGTETMFDNVEVIPVTGITIAGADTRSLQRGQTLQLTANIAPANATNRNITWTSSNTNVATVSANGQITGINHGTVIITARTANGNHSATVTVAVTPQQQNNNNNEQSIVFEPITVTGITISGSATRNMTAGQTLQLTANITPSNATNQNITWTSSNTAVATVSANGQVTAISAGTATITARSTDGNRTATVTITVTAPPQQGNNVEQPTVTPQQRALPFTDVTTAHWAYGSIRYVFENNIMQGTGATTFAPNMEFTRAMVVAILYRMTYGNTANEVPYARNRNIFNDVAVNRWYSPYIAWAYDNSIVMGIGQNLFAPNDSVTHEQLITMLYRFAGFIEIDTVVSNNSRWNNLINRNQVSSWAIEPFRWAVYHEIIGDTILPTIIVPNAFSHRAEVATIIMRFRGAFDINNYK